LLQTKFVPVAIDQAYQRRQQDTEGEFYRKIAAAGPRNNFNGTTQGLYIAAADGTFLGYTNHRSPDRVRKLIDESLAKFKPAETETIEQTKVDERWNPVPPKGGLVVRVNAKVMGGYESTDDHWQQIFQTAVSRDNLWISAEEHQQLVKGEFPESLSRRIARFHLVDNTRGEPPMWEPSDIKSVKVQLEKNRVSGTVQLETKSGDRGYDAKIIGFIETQNDHVTKLDLVCQGDFWGDGTYTRGAPKGKFPLAIAFTLADGSDVADAIPPQASRGWLRGYFE
jgi:hypothetical protein